MGEISIHGLWSLWNEHVYAPLTENEMGRLHSAINAYLRANKHMDGLYRIGEALEYQLSTGGGWSEGTVKVCSAGREYEDVNTRRPDKTEGRL